MSSIVPCAPSNSTEAPPSIQRDSMQRGVGDVGREPARVAEVRGQDPLHREGLGVVDLAQEPVLLLTF